jgi:hypothetical protein
MTGECQEDMDMESFYHSNQHNWEETKFHLETAAMAGNEVARNTLGELEFDHLHNNDQAIKHWIISASAGEYHAMYHLLLGVGNGMVSKDAIDTTLTVYNNACANMRSEARDNLISVYIDDGEEAKLYL